jgi:hypothetical protein
MTTENTQTAPKGGHDVKLKFVPKDIPVEKLHVNPENLRFRKGMVVDGIKVVDTYNAGTMKDAIREQGGIPGRLVVEEFTAPEGPLGEQLVKEGKLKPGEVYYNTLAGNRRLTAVQEMLADKTTSVELVETLSKLPCNVYKNLDDQQRRELVNDQRSQRYQRAELVTYIWKLQAGGMSFADICMFVYPQMIGYTGQGQKMLPKIDACKTQDERKKVVTEWLKGTLDSIILTAGKLGPRVRRALLLSDMMIDGIAPVIGKDSEGEPIYETPEFKPSQGRCRELARAKKADEQSPAGWTPENGGSEFNATLAKFIREDKGVDENGNPIQGPAQRASVEQLNNQKTLTQSRAAKAALEIASGKPVLQFADFDAEARRLELLTDVATKYKDGVKDKKVKEMLTIFLTGDASQLENFLAANS